MKERRKHKRYSVAYPIEGPLVEQSMTDNLVDVSKNGIAFVGKGDVKKDKTISIRLFLKNRMFNLNAVVIYVKKLTRGEQIIGAQLIDAPREFESIFDKEIDEIKNLHREANQHKHSTSSFKKVSQEYLETLGIS